MERQLYEMKPLQFWNAEQKWAGTERVMWLLLIALIIFLK